MVIVWIALFIEKLLFKWLSNTQKLTRDIYFFLCDNIFINNYICYITTIQMGIKILRQKFVKTGILCLLIIFFKLIDFWLSFTAVPVLPCSPCIIVDSVRLTANKNTFLDIDTHFSFITYSHKYRSENPSHSNYACHYTLKTT